MGFFLLAVTSEILTNKGFGLNYFPWEAVCLKKEKLSQKEKEVQRMCVCVRLKLKVMSLHDPER